MRARIVLLLMLMSFLWVLLIGRAAFLQIIPDGRLKALQKRQFETVVTLNPRRGDVIDRNGHELAVSMTTYSLFADPKIIEEPKQVVRFLASTLKLPVKQIDEKLRNRKKRFVWIERGLNKSVRDAIADERIRGLGFIEESRRIYPNERLLSHVLGFVGNEEQGLEGLELQYNDHLQAAKKKVSVRRDARGRPLIVNGQLFNQVPDGSDLQLTVDRELQFILEQELAQAVSRHMADNAYGVVLDAQTSEILAMASSPAFDPNRASNFPVDFKRNRAVTDSFEPGSTLKTFVIAGALAKGLVDTQTPINCEGGTMRIGKRVIREADSKHAFNTLSVAEILARSSNIGTTKIAFKLGDDGVLATLKNFGFGEKTGVDLPGEAKGIVQTLPWRDHLLANVSFGHGMTVTPLQIANAYAVIANGGWLKQPYIVKSIRDHENSEEIEMRPKTLRRVLNEAQVVKMRQMLLGVTGKDGTGMNARVPGFPVAGKTGTAQKVNPNGRGYLRGGYISSFAGFLPAQNPRFVIYVAIDHPRKEYYGSAVAAPVFSRVASFAVRKAGLAPVVDAESLRLTETKSAPAPESVPALAEREETKSVRVPSVQDPDPAEITMASVSAVTHEEMASDGVVPDLTGLTLREVLSRVSGAGVEVLVKGKGFVTQTLPTAGAKIGSSKQITIYMGE